MLQRFIKRYLKKKLNCSSPEDYHFLRWLAEHTKDEKATKNVLSDIALFMFKNNTDIPFTDIFVVDENIYVYTVRPGLWIGKAGHIMDEILHYINYDSSDNNVSNYKIQLLENTKGAEAEIITSIRVLNDFC